MQVTITMEEYTKLITANAKHLEQLNKLMEKYDRLNEERLEQLKNKNKGCEFCEGENSHCSHGLEIDLVNDKLNFSYYSCACGSFEDNKWTINYCPICGRNLEG